MKTQNIKTVEYTFKIPTDLICAIEYGDFDSDLNEMDIHAVKLFWDKCAELRKENNGDSYSLQYSESHDFGLFSYPFSVLAEAGEVTECTVTIHIYK